MTILKEPHLLTNTHTKFTGKHLVLLDKKATARTISAYSKNADLKLAAFSDYKNDMQAYTQAFKEGDGIVFDHFGVAVINENHERQLSILTNSRSKSTFLHAEPERYLYALAQKTKVTGKPMKTIKSTALKTMLYADTPAATWGLQAINALNTNFKGKGINIAILDTGLNVIHPDFEKRILISKSFIKGELEHDLGGHGSHCAGIALGGKNVKTNKRYGVASEANLYIGKVLSNKGVGTDSSILAGMEWAIMSNCKVISMSLGAVVEQGEAYSQIYNNLAKKALLRGTLIVAAAGNDSERSLGRVVPVSHPANCPSIMSVAALDQNLEIADFSNAGLLTEGGQIDIAAPGVAIYSSWKEPRFYKVMDGTSMAAPYVAGAAALLWEANPLASAAEIWMQLTQNARRLPLNASDVGAGLVQII